MLSANCFLHTGNWVWFPCKTAIFLLETAHAKKSEDCSEWTGFRVGSEQIGVDAEPAGTGSGIAPPA